MLKISRNMKVKRLSRGSLIYFILICHFLSLEQQNKEFSLKKIKQHKNCVTNEFFTNDLI